MLKIRLQRIGRINSPAYRIVVTEHARAAKKGLLEKLGTYNPKTKERNVNEARVKYWISVGAQPSATMHNMLISMGVITGKKINVLPQYKAPVVEEVADSTSSPQAEAVTPVAEAPAPEVAAAEEPVAEVAAPEVPVEETPIIQTSEEVVESSSPEAREEAAEVEADAKAA